MCPVIRPTCLPCVLSSVPCACHVSRLPGMCPVIHPTCLSSVSCARHVSCHPSTCLFFVLSFVPCACHNPCVPFMCPVIRPMCLSSVSCAYHVSCHPSHVPVICPVICPMCLSCFFLAFVPHACPVFCVPVMCPVIHPSCLLFVPCLCSSCLARYSPEFFSSVFSAFVFFLLSSSHCFCQASSPHSSSQDLGFVGFWVFRIQGFVFILFSKLPSCTHSFP